MPSDYGTAENWRFGGYLKVIGQRKLHEKIMISGEEVCIARCTIGEMNCTALVDESYVQICEYILKTYFLVAF